MTTQRTLCLTFACALLAQMLADSANASTRYDSAYVHRKKIPGNVSAEQHGVRTLRKRFPGNHTALPRPITRQQTHAAAPRSAAYETPTTYEAANSDAAYYRAYQQRGYSAYRYSGHNKGDSRAWLANLSKENFSSFNIGAGYRVDDFQWNIAGNSAGTSPNILSELTWTDVSYAVIDFEYSYIYRPHGDKLGYYAELSGFYGEAFAGDNQDSDYLGNNRTLEFSRSNNTSDSGYTEGIKLALGAAYTVERPTALYRLIGFGGYSYRENEFDITNGVQTIPATGPFGGLNSSYNAMWRGPFIGMESANYFSSGQHFLRLRGEYHIVNYDAVANWNLRTAFAHPESFRHLSEGDGMVLMAEYRYAFDPRLWIGIRGQYEEWIIDNGVDRTNLATGGAIATQFNEAELTSQSYFITLGYQF